MKKKIITSLLIAVCLTGCGETAQTAETSQSEVAKAESSEVTQDAVEEVETVEPADTEETAGLANPMKEITDEDEIFNLSYNLIPPKDAENLKTFLINDTLFEQQFEYMDGDYTLRVQPGEEYEDISGMYYEWTSETDMNYPIDGNSHLYDYEGEDEFVEVLCWYEAEKNINCSLSVVAKETTSVYGALDKILPLRIKNKGDGSENATVSGLTSVKNVEDALNSFINWAGFQSFYEGMEFEELTDDIRVAMAVYCAQTNDTECVLDETGCMQIVSAEKINKAMMDLFGQTYDIKADSEVCEKGNFELKSDNSAYIQLGDWGLIGPELEIYNISELGDSEGRYDIACSYYPHDYYYDHIAENIPNYVCDIKCIPNEESEYGISIVEMSGKIVKE